MTQLHEFADFVQTFTRELLDDDEPVPKVRQMMNEAGYIDYIREQAATPAQEKASSTTSKVCITVSKIY